MNYFKMLSMAKLHKEIHRSIKNKTPKTVEQPLGGPVCTRVEYLNLQRMTMAVVRDTSEVL